jgi:hypothetical protein
LRLDAICVSPTVVDLTAGRSTGGRIAALAAFVVHTLPHVVFHGLHLDGFPTADAVAQTAGFAVQLSISSGQLVVLTMRGGPTAIGSPPEPRTETPTSRSGA